VGGFIDVASDSGFLAISLDNVALSSIRLFLGVVCFKQLFNGFLDISLGPGLSACALDGLTPAFVGAVVGYHSLGISSL
jgi:hypothetical protein